MNQNAKFPLTKFTTQDKKKIPQDIFHFYYALSARKTEEANLFRKKAWRFWILRCK